MKTRIERKLELHRETLRLIDTRELARVGAGMPHPAPSDDSACCTLPGSFVC